MAGSSLLVLSLTTIVFLLEYVAAEDTVYLEYPIKMERDCSDYMTVIQVTMTSPVLLEGGNLGNVAASQPIECVFQIEHQKKLLPKPPSIYLPLMLDGVVAVVQKMKFRDAGLFCLDYMDTQYTDRYGLKLEKWRMRKVKQKELKKLIHKYYGRGNTLRLKRDEYFVGLEDILGPRVCGDILFGIHVDENGNLPPPPSSAPLPPHAPNKGSISENPFWNLTSVGASVDPHGRPKTYLHISNRTLGINESIELTVVYTGYKACDGLSVPADLFHCGYGLCISRSLVNDGYVNCPFGDCVDEGNCTNAKSPRVKAPKTRDEYLKTPWSSRSVYVRTIPISVAAFTVAGVLKCFCRKIVEEAKRQDSAEEEEEMQRDFQDPNKDQPGYPQPGCPPQGQAGCPPPQGYPQPG